MRDSRANPVKRHPVTRAEEMFVIVWKTNEYLSAIGGAERDAVSPLSS